MGDSTAEGVAPTVRPHARPGAIVYAAMVLQTLISAGTFLVAKRSLQEIHPIAALASRFLLSGIVFWLILLAVPGRAVPPRRAWKKALILGLLAGPLNQGLFFWGLSRSTPAHAATPPKMKRSPTSGPIAARSPRPSRRTRTPEKAMAIPATFLGEARSCPRRKE